MNKSVIEFYLLSNFKNTASTNLCLSQISIYLAVVSFNSKVDLCLQWCSVMAFLLYVIVRILF